MTPAPRNLPKVELHLHLEGALTPAEALGLARRGGAPVEVDAIRSLYRHESFSQFLAHFGQLVGYLREPRDVAWLLHRLLGRLKRQGVVYAEIRVSPSVWERHGLPARETFLALLGAREKGAVPCGLIVDGVRQWDRALLARDLDLATEFRGRGVAALGLGGDEAAAPAACFGDLASECRSRGVPLIPHAGEALGPEEVASALAMLSPPRIAHGIAAAGDPLVIEELVRRKVHLEVCPTSNLRTGVVRRAQDHPLGKLWSAGVSLSLGTDDPALFRTCLSREYAWALRHAGWTTADLARSQVEAARAALRPPSGREALERSVLAGWSAN